jgi:hypothetical protein
METATLLPLIDLDKILVFRNEPRMRAAMDGFLAMPSVAMRLAPEVLLLELYREVFYAHERGDTAVGVQLNPDQRGPDSQLLYTASERAVINALQGRRKLTKQCKSEAFYAPAYKSLARHAWLAKKRERIIARLLLGGAVSQSLWATGRSTAASERQRLFSIALATALVGTEKHAPPPAGELRGDLLAQAIEVTPSSDDINAGSASICRLTDDESQEVASVADPLPDRIFFDLLAICELERSIPRLLWLQILMTFLRFSLPMWLLAQMQMTVHLHRWLLAAVTSGTVPSMTEVQTCLTRRHERLLSPTITATSELFDRIISYVKCRVETNLLLFCLESLRPKELAGRKVVYQCPAAVKDRISIDRLLSIAVAAQADLRNEPAYAHAPSPALFLERACQQRFAAWRDPLNKGQGANIDEFFRVLYRAEQGDDLGGYLLRREGRGDTKGFRVFPGSLLLQTVCFLASRDKRRKSQVPGGGRLALQDVEDHFHAYGVDFSVAADARPLIIGSLQDLGLLHGSPDAGSSVAVFCPFADSADFLMR